MDDRDPKRDWGEGGERNAMSKLTVADVARIKRAGDREVRRPNKNVIKTTFEYGTKRQPPPMTQGGCVVY